MPREWQKRANMRSRDRVLDRGDSIRERRFILRYASFLLIKTRFYHGETETSWYAAFDLKGKCWVTSKSCEINCEKSMR